MTCRDLLRLVFKTSLMVIFEIFFIKIKLNSIQLLLPVNGGKDVGVYGRWEINKGLRINKLFNKEQEKTMVY